MTALSKRDSRAPQASPIPAESDPNTSHTPDNLSDAHERERVHVCYAAYAADPAQTRAWSDGPAVAFIRDRKWNAIRGIVAEMGAGRRIRRILDVGAWTGGDTVHLRDLGDADSTVVALDLLEWPLRKAQLRFRVLDCVVGHGSRLPIRDGVMDVVYQCTMLSSVLEQGRRERVLAEVRRVLAPGGLFVSFDMRYPNPWNSHVRRVTGRELRAAFLDWPVSMRTTTLLPPLLRRLAPLSGAACAFLERVPVLRSHLLFAARKPDAPSGRRRGPSNLRST